MESRYDAFISYRHAVKDTQIAAEIQKSLEHFDIPKALRKKTGKKRFNRVFRDVEELPISSNLTEDIEEALRVSEFLIVICSFSTSESDWVKREIDTFLELHDYNKQLILTVLVEGEPDEVIPEILRHDNITHYLADGTFYCKDEVVEPLAADYRMPVSKARKIELPRLAAAMLGCNYDDIIRRRKAYKRTRLLIETALVSAAAIAFAIYVGFMVRQINVNLQNSKMNQSRYYASESLKLLDEGDRIGAIQLALAAFEDSDGTRRPVTDEAQFAIASALGAYTTQGTSDSVPVWRYETSATIIKYASTGSDGRVVALDSSGILHIWKREESNEQILKDDENGIQDFRLDKNNDVIVLSSKYVALYDAGTLQQKWKTDNERNIYSNRDLLMEYYEKQGYVVLNANTSLIIINAENGKVVKQLETKKNSSFEASMPKSAVTGFSIYRFLINNDFTTAVLIGSFGGVNNNGMFVCDMEKEKWSCVASESGDYLNAAFDQEGNILALRRPNDDLNAAGYAGTDQIYESTVILEQINSSGKTVWKTEFTSLNRVVDTKVFDSAYKLKDGSETKVVMAAVGNKMVIVDKKTGKLIKSYDFLASIIRTVPTKTSISVVLRNGIALWVPLDASKKNVTSAKYFMDGILELQLTRDKNDQVSYLVKDSTQRVITEYSGNFTDTEYTGFENSGSEGIVSYSAKCGDYLVTYHESSKICGSDLKTRKVIWTVDAPKNNLVYFDNSVSPDNRFVYFLKSQKNKDGDEVYTLIKINAANGQIADCNSEFTVDSLFGVTAVNGRVWAKYTEAETKKLTLISYNMVDDTVKKTLVDKEIASGAYYLVKMGPSPDGKKVLLYYCDIVDGQHRTSRLTVDTETGTFTSADCGYCEFVAWNEAGGLFAEIYSEGDMKVFAADGTERFTKDIEQRIPKKVRFNGETLYVVYSTDVLCGYDKNGNQVMTINLNHGDLKSSDNVFFEFVNDYLFLTVGMNTDIIDLKEAKSICSFAGFLCIYGAQPKDRTMSDAIVVCKAFDDEGVAPIGYFNYKTPERMIEQAKKYLEKTGAKMSDEFRRKYGMD